MISKLVLVRHGKAQEQEASLPDAQRQLTAAGLASIEARYPITFGLLADDATGVRVWSSPALRAMQTAEVVAEVMGVSSVETRQSLFSGDIDAFLDELSEEQGTIIAVGHNPFMAELYERLTGASQELKPGAAASIDMRVVDDDATREVSLEWFVQAPRVSRWQTLVDLKEGLESAASRIERCNEALLENMDDPESLHQYRVALEIARALLRFVKPYCKGKQIRKTIRDIDELMRRSHRLRDFDVLLQAIDATSPEALSLRDTVMHERESFHERFSSLATQKCIARVAKRLREIPWRPAVLAHGLSKSKLAERVADMQTRFESEMAHVPYDVQDEVLDLRKQARALQYVLREFEACLPDSAASNSMRAQAVQERLGELCDCWVNARFIVAVCGPSAINTAARFVVRADAIVDDFKTGRTYGLAISDS